MHVLDLTKSCQLDHQNNSAIRSFLLYGYLIPTALQQSTLESSLHFFFLLYSVYPSRIHCKQATGVLFSPQWPKSRASLSQPLQEFTIHSCILKIITSSVVHFVKHLKPHEMAYNLYTSPWCPFNSQIFIRIISSLRWTRSRMNQRNFLLNLKRRNVNDLSNMVVEWAGVEKEVDPPSLVVLFKEKYNSLKQLKTVLL